MVFQYEVKCTISGEEGGETEAINGWIKGELFLDFGLLTVKGDPKLLDEYAHY